jgi:hypothetical protein
MDDVKERLIDSLAALVAKISSGGYVDRLGHDALQLAPLISALDLLRDLGVDPYERAVKLQADRYHQPTGWRGSGDGTGH